MSDEYTAGMWIDVNTDNGLSSQASELVECCRGSGTIGCFARKDGQPVLVTCAHVLFPKDLAPATGAVFQPRFSCCCSGDQIATPIADPLKDGKYDGYNEVRLEVWVYYGNSKAPVLPGQVPNGKSPTDTDCASALLRPGLKFRNVWRYSAGGQVKEIPLVGSFKDSTEAKLGVTKGNTFGTRPTSDQYVRIYSERLGKVVWGTVLSVPKVSLVVETPSVDDPQHLLTVLGYGDPVKERLLVHQLMVLPRPEPKPSVPYEDEYDGFHHFGTDNGDSGAMVINSANQIIGMLWGGVPPLTFWKQADIDSTMELAHVSLIAAVTPIRAIEAQLGITIPDDPNGWSGTVPSEGARAFGSSLRQQDSGARQRGLVRIRDGLRRSRRGRLILGKIGQHGRELRLMFNRVRVLAATWQKLRGPAFLHHGVQSLERPDHVVPQMIDGVSRRALVDALLPIIIQHASLELRRDLKRHRSWAEAIILDTHTLDDVINAVMRP